jgi:hypothetical protein
MYDKTLLPIIIWETSILSKRVHALYWKVNRLLLKVSNILRINLFVMCLGMLSWLIHILPRKSLQGMRESPGYFINS